jgi:transcriptional regulator with PAS, ATPase and Fis domain
LVVPALELVVVDGPDRGLRHAVSRSARIGVAEGNEVRLTDPTVSRLHAIVSLGVDGARLRDAGSKNGTYVDGVRVRDATIVASSLLRVGSSTLRVEAGDERATVELSAKTSIGDLVGASAAMRQVYALIERVGPTESTVLIQGETGTGKELVARALHQLSSRASKRFLAIDCGAIPEHLLESELFGHLRGSFSGAVNDRAGAFEEAEHGTLFFDEIGELPVQMQRKLLRALETREIRRVGSNKERRIDVRVLAATNRPFNQAVNDGLFREDLYYRLAVVTIELPPLRARREDILPLAQHFLDRFTGGGTLVSTRLASALMGRGWSGNVRELKNYIERHVSLTGPEPTTEAGQAAVPPTAADALVDADLPYKDARDAWLTRFDAIYVRALLAKTGGNVTRAAERAGISRRFLQRQMLRLGLRDPDGDAKDDDEG